MSSSYTPGKERQYPLNRNKPHVNKIHVYAKQQLACLQRLTNERTKYLKLNGV
jgi:hypothetical protein